MKKQSYREQVTLMLTTLPEVAKEACFALHGGTAINLFVRDMPRLSVDIDLTYISVGDRENSLNNISEALERIKKNIEVVVKNVRVTHRRDVAKLQISYQGIQIKLEVNLVSRGTLDFPQKMTLCERAQNEFDSFCSIQVVPIQQLYGGKICAALDRQHPRDLFDVKYLLENEGFSQKIKEGFLFCLLCSDRPINELIRPNFQNQMEAMINQFEGMSFENFDYDDYEKTRENLISTIHSKLTTEDRNFLLNVKNVTPDWSVYDFEKFPAIKWKLKNLEKLKTNNPEKHMEQYEELKRKLSCDDFS